MVDTSGLTRRDLIGAGAVGAFGLAARRDVLRAAPHRVDVVVVGGGVSGLAAARKTFDTRFIRAALSRAGGHRARAAKDLGVTRQGLTKLMVRLGLN